MLLPPLDRAQLLRPSLLLLSLRLRRPRQAAQVKASVAKAPKKCKGSVGAALSASAAEAASPAAPKAAGKARSLGSEQPKTPPKTSRPLPKLACDSPAWKPTLRGGEAVDRSKSTSSGTRGCAAVVAAMDRCFCEAAKSKGGVPYYSKALGSFPELRYHCVRLGHSGSKHLSPWPCAFST